MGLSPRVSSIVCVCLGVLAAGPVRAQVAGPGVPPAPVGADPAASGDPVIGGITIDGPPPPIAPEVVARDARGRVTVRAIRLEEPLRLDGRLDEAVYSTERAIDGFIQQEPREGEPVSEKTEAWILFDAENIYVSVRCWDSQPDRMVLNEMRRDSPNIFQNESMTVVLDTFYDRRNAFYFQTNPLGAIRDGLVTDERNNNNDWNTVWDTRSARFDQGWTVEMMFPFKSLRYREGPVQVWGINIRRGVRWKNEQQFLTPIPASYGFRGVYKFSSAATLVGLETPAQSRNFELKPYAISELKTDRAADPALSNDLGGDLGLDAKYGITKSLTADFTVNTDFAQVEQDEQQVNLTRFSLFFPEKRDFFLEGQGVFSFGGASSGGRGGGEGFAGVPSLTPILFFSRRIGLEGGVPVPIQAGGRLTGRAGAYTLGLLNIQTDDLESAGVGSTNFSVVRMRRDVLRRSAIGLIATNRSPATGGGTNQAFGLDAQLAFFENLAVSGYYAMTASDGSTTDADSYRGYVEYAGDRYGAGYEHLFVGDQFNPQIGFLRRPDFRRNFGHLRFSPRPERAEVIRKYHYEVSLDHITDSQGLLETREAIGSFRMEFQNSDNWTVEYLNHYEFLEDPFEIASDVTLPVGGYDFQEARTSYQLGQQRKVAGTVSLGRGSFYSGTRTDAEYSGRVDLGMHLSIEPRISFNWIDLAEGAFTTTLVSARTNVMVSPRMFTGALLQYNSSNDSLSANIRFRWEYQPGSDIFVVYTEGRDTRLGGFPALENRGFVVKFTRLFRF